MKPVESLEERVARATDATLAVNEMRVAQDARVSLALPVTTGFMAVVWSPLFWFLLPVTLVVVAVVFWVLSVMRAEIARRADDDAAKAPP